MDLSKLTILKEKLKKIKDSYEGECKLGDYAKGRLAAIKMTLHILNDIELTPHPTNDDCVIAIKKQLKDNGYQ